MEYVKNMAHESSAGVAINLTIVCAITLLAYLVSRARTRKTNGVNAPGPMGLPLVGNFFSLVFARKQHHEVIDEWSHRYGRVFTFRLLNSQIYVLSDVKLVQKAYQSQDLNDRMSFAANREIMGRDNCGIGTSNGVVWKEQRRFFMTVFKKVDMSVIRFEEIIGSQAKRFITEVEKYKGQSFNPMGYVKNAAANIITRIITGINYEYNDPDFDHMIKCTTQVLDLLGPAGLFALIPVLSTIPSPRKTKIIGLIKEIMKSIEKAVNSHKADFDPNDPATDFIACYLKEIAQRSSENNKGMFDDINLLASSLDALVPGWETNATTMSWILFLMAKHPEEQERVRQEMSEVVGDGRVPTFLDRHSMPVTLATIAECMRVKPPSAFNLPHLATADMKIGGFDIPKGGVVMTNFWYMNLSPDIWDEPRVFRPQRFLDKDGRFNKALEPFPFGCGPRVCPGEQLARMELFLLTTHILQHYKLSLPDGAPRTNIGNHGLTNRPDPYEIHAIKIQ